MMRLRLPTESRTSSGGTTMTPCETWSIGRESARVTSERETTLGGGTISFSNGEFLDLTCTCRFDRKMNGHKMMAASTRMYSYPLVYPLLPQHGLPPEEFMQRMYKMRNIHEDTADTRSCRHDVANRIATEAKMLDDVVALQVPSPEYKLLEARQEKILNQLAELKKQVSKLCQVLKQSNQEIKKPVHLVVYAGPKKPPFSIIALQKLWNDICFNIVTHIHSSLKDEVFIPIILKPKQTSVSKNIIQLTLIWKDVPDLEVIVNTHSCPIRGEVNFLRLMSRLVESHNYESACSKPELLDRALDYINFLHTQQNIKPGIYVLEDVFNSWFKSSKGGYNIADIAMWSLIKQYREKDLPPILQKWFAHCDSFFSTD